MADTLLHNFHSTIADDPNALLVRPSDWNERHVFNGGSDGNLLVRDVTQFSGFRFDTIANLIAGRIIGYTVNGETANPISITSPTVEFCITPFTKILGNSKLLTITQAYLADSTFPSGNANGTLFITVDSVPLTSTSLAANGVYTPYIIFLDSLTAGAHTISGHIASNSSPIIGVGLSFILLEFTVG